MAAHHVVGVNISYFLIHFRRSALLFDEFMV